MTLLAFGSSKFMQQAFLFLGVQCLLIIVFVSYKRPYFDERLIQGLLITKAEEKVTKEELPTAAAREKKSKPFAYHVLTEECLPGYLLMDFVLGDALDRDVYVLSFVKPCVDPDKKPSHVTYINGKGTSWSQGRNILFQHVYETGAEYDYHIYIDDDAILFYTDELDKFSSEKGIDQELNAAEFMTAFSESKDGLESALYNWTKSPWRTFEETLIKNSPAFAQVNLAQKVGFQSRRLQLQKWKLLCVHPEMPSITPTLFLDTIIVAYHKKALPLVMPYDATLDDHSWFISAMYQMYRMKAILFKQGIAIWPLTVLNLKHRPYPRNQPPADYLQTYFEGEGRSIQQLLDIRDRDFVMYYDGGKWEDVFFGDMRLCTAPLKFPIEEHYKLSMEEVH